MNDRLRASRGLSSDDARPDHETPQLEGLDGGVRTPVEPEVSTSDVMNRALRVAAGRGDPRRAIRHQRASDRGLADGARRIELPRQRREGVLRPAVPPLSPDLRNARAVRRLRLVDPDGRVVRSRWQEVERVQDERRCALVSHVVDFGRMLQEP